MAVDVADDLAVSPAPKSRAETLASAHHSDQCVVRRCSTAVGSGYLTGHPFSTLHLERLTLKIGQHIFRGRQDRCVLRSAGAPGQVGQVVGDEQERATDPQ